jgi:hypothetical protein
MHAFDSIKRNKILDSLTQNKTPSKLIRLIKLTLENTTAKVKVNNAYTMEFRVESRVKQGDPLSPTLLIIARTKQSLIYTFQQSKNNSMEVGLIINEKKTKYLKCTKKRYQNREFKYQQLTYIASSTI